MDVATGSARALRSLPGRVIKLAVLVSVVGAALIAVAVPQPRQADASFHIARISEVMFGANGDPNVQYVEINMLTIGQNVVGHTRLSAWNADGSFFGVLLEVPSNVGKSNTDVKWIMATPGFEAAAGITPDFTFAPASLQATGMVCWGAPGVSAQNPPTWDASNPANYVDCIPYGGYAAGNIRFPTASPFGLGDGTQSLTRTSSTNNTSVDMVLACPTPQANNGAIGFNHDGNFVDQSPPKSVDDLTWINSDTVGDHCGDTDDDNDGLSDTAEAAGAPCASATAATDPLARDTDGDLVLDGAECALGSNPNDVASKPLNPTVANDPDGDRLSTAFENSIGTSPSNPDSDGDGLRDGVEVKNYNSNPLSTNTDAASGDTTTDDCEVSSINLDTKVNPGDQALLSSEVVRVPPPPRLANLDLNKDGAVNPGDQAFQSNRALSGKCP
jgi:hypothetical protein